MVFDDVHTVKTKESKHRSVELLFFTVYSRGDPFVNIFQNLIMQHCGLTGWLSSCSRVHEESEGPRGRRDHQEAG